MKLTLILLLCFMKTFAQQGTQTIQGVVYNSESGEPYAFANIHIGNYKTLSDLDGKFSLDVPKTIIYGNTKQYMYVEYKEHLAKDSILLNDKVELLKLKIFLKKNSVELKANPPVGEQIKLIEK